MVVVKQQQLVVSSSFSPFSITGALLCNHRRAVAAFSSFTAFSLSSSTHLFTSSTSQSVAGRRAVVRTLDAQRRTACSVGEMPFAGESIVFFSLSVTTSALPDERTANYLSAAHSHAHNLSTVQFTFRLLLQFSVFMFICPSDSVQQHHSIAIYQCIN